jgi:hypothetical protein
LTTKIVASIAAAIRVRDAHYRGSVENDVIIGFKGVGDDSFQLLRVEQRHRAFQDASRQ